LLNHTIDLTIRDNSPRREFWRCLSYLVPSLSAIVVVAFLADNHLLGQSSGTKKGASAPSKKADGTKRKLKTIAFTPAPDKEDLAVIQALQKETTVSWKSLPLSEAVTQLEQEAEITIVLDEKSIAGASITTEAPVEADLKKATVGSILNAVLPKLNLDYLIEGGKVVVVSQRDAIGKTVERTYVLKSVAKNAKEGRAVVSELLKVTRARDEWGDVGGYATLAFDEKKLELRIRHTHSDHMRIYSYLCGQRN
jgi:hypothetical protein